MGLFDQQETRFGPPLTPTVKKLIILNVAVHLSFLLSRLVAPVLISQLYANLVLIPEDFLFNGKLWQILTYAFLHSLDTPLHLLFNMLVLWMFGSEIEAYWGKRPFLLFYLLCAIGGGLAVVLSFLAFRMTTPTLGASGAILGLIAAYGFIFAERRIFLLFPPVTIKGKWMAVFVIAMDILFFLHGSGISLSAHLGGAFTGFLYMKSGFRFSASPTWRVGGLTLGQHLRRWVTRRHLKVIVRDDDDDDEADRGDIHSNDPTYH